MSAPNKWRIHPNGQSSYVTTAYTSGGTSLVVAAGSNFTNPASGQELMIRVDDEIFAVSSITSNTLTLVGAQEGTTAASHAVGAIVYTVFSGGEADRLRQQFDLQTTSGAPSSPTYTTPMQMMYDPTANLLYIWNGTAWKSAAFT